MFNYKIGILIAKEVNKLIVMKKVFLSMMVASFIFSCDPKADNVQPEDYTSEEVLEDNATPEHYQGSTGFEERNRNMEASENIQLKKTEFKGSFSNVQTLTYVLTVLEGSMDRDYSFRLESDNPEVQYMITHREGPVVQEPTRENTTHTLEPGEYTIIGVLENEAEMENTKEIDFTVYIE